MNHTTSQPPSLDNSIIELSGISDLHTCHTLHSWHCGRGESALPGGGRLLVKQGLLMVASLLMLLGNTSMLVLR